MASRYDDLFNKMTNGTNYMDKVNGSGYSESKKNFGYNTEGKQLYDLNKKSPDSYTSAPGYSNDDSIQTFKNAGNNAVQEYENKVNKYGNPFGYNSNTNDTKSEQQNKYNNNHSNNAHYDNNHNNSNGYNTNNNGNNYNGNSNNNGYYDNHSNNYNGNNNNGPRGNYDNYSNSYNGNSNGSSNNNSPNNNYYDQRYTENAYDKLRNIGYSKGKSYETETQNQQAIAKQVNQLAASGLHGTDVYQGYEKLKRAYNFASAVTGVGIIKAYMGLTNTNMHYDNTALNTALRKNGYQEIIRDNGISNREFTKNLENAFKANNDSGWKNVILNSKYKESLLNSTEFSGTSDIASAKYGTSSSIKKGKNFDHIEYSGKGNSDLINGKVTVVTKDGSKYKISINDLIINTKDGNVSGKGYVNQFLSNKESKKKNILSNNKNINSFLKNDTIFGQLGIHNMNSKEIRSRMRINKNGTASFTYKGKTQVLSVEQSRVLQDIAHNIELKERMAALNKAKNKRSKIFKRETDNLAKDNDLYQGTKKTHKAIKIIKQTVKTPFILLNARVNHKRTKFEKMQKKGNLDRVLPGIHSQKVAKFRQAKYNVLYGKQGALTIAQKDIGKSVRQGIAKQTHKAAAKTGQAIKVTTKKYGGKAKNAIKRNAKGYVNYNRMRSKTFNNIMSKGEKIAGKITNIKGKYSTKYQGFIKKKNAFFANHPKLEKIKNFTKRYVPFSQENKNARKARKIRKDKRKNFVSKIISKLKWGLIVFGIVICLIITLPSVVIIIGPSTITSAIAGGITAITGAKKIEQAQEKAIATASTKQIYEFMHEEYPSMSTADILGIMSLMKYESDLNAFYYSDDYNYAGLLGFNEEEQDAIDKICSDNGWGDPFDIDIDDDIDDEDDTGADIDLDHLKNSRRAQVKYICTLINDSNYPSISEVSPDTMAEQAVNFAINVRDMDIDYEAEERIKQNAIDMYYEYVMWDIEFLKPTNDYIGNDLINAALFPYARTYAGELVDMHTLYGTGNYFGSLTTDWSGYFVKYAFAQTDLTDEYGLYYITQNLNDIGNLIDIADERGFWHSYEEVVNTNNEDGIKPGYLAITQSSDSDGNTIYKIGIVLNVQYSWDESSGTAETTYTIIEGDDYGTNYAYNPQTDSIENINAKQTGSSDHTTVKTNCYSLVDAKCSDTNHFDEYADIAGFIAWYDPVESMANHEWRKAEDAKNAEIEEPDPEPDPEPEEPEEPDNGDDNSGDGEDSGDDGDYSEPDPEPQERHCEYCGMSESEYDEFGYDCDYAEGHVWIY